LDNTSIIIPEEPSNKFNQIKINEPKMFNPFELREIKPIGNNPKNFSEYNEKPDEDEETLKKPKFKFLKRNSKKLKEKETQEAEEINKEIKNPAENGDKTDGNQEESDIVNKPKFQFLKRKKNQIVNEKVFLYF
jgi:hypothetical protein